MRSGFGKKGARSVLALLVTVALAFGLVPVGAFAFAATQTGASTEFASVDDMAADKGDAPDTEKKDGQDQEQSSGKTEKTGLMKQQGEKDAEPGTETSGQKGQPSEQNLTIMAASSTATGGSQQPEGDGSDASDTPLQAQATGVRATITVVPPTAGETSATQPNAEGSNSATCTSAKWCDSNGVPLSNTVTFVEGQTYYINAVVVPATAGDYFTGLDCLVGTVVNADKLGYRTWEQFDGTLCTVQYNPIIAVPAIAATGNSLIKWGSNTNNGSVQYTYTGPNGTQASGTQYGNSPWSCKNGTTATLKAVPNEGNAFVGWFKADYESFTPSGDALSTDPVLTLTVTSALDQTAYCAVFCPHDTLTAYAAVAATCTEEGTEAYWKCDTCGKLFSDAQHKTEISEPVKVAALGHDWDEGTVATEATCTKPGVKTFTCKRDATHTRTEDVAALGHDWGEWAETDGKATRTCKRDASHTETVDVAYATVSGDGATWEKGSSDPLTFTFKRNVNDGKTFKAYKGTKVDGVDVPESAIATAEGSLVLSMTTTYLETLSVGDHKLTVAFEDGEATASFTVKAAETKAAAASASSKSSSPKTGDAMPVSLLAVSAALSAAVLLAARARTRQPLRATGKHARR